jgi:2-deoxy-D-gluconate 3-dehydrogenase
MKNISQLFSLEGKAGIVTGGSQGLGVGIAKGLVQAGANVMLASRNSEKLEEVARDLGHQARWQRTDVRSKDELKLLVEETLKAFGKIDFLFNNAGIIRRYPSEEHPEQDWDDVINTNLKSVFLLSQMVARVMIEENSGSIINTASLLSVEGGKRVVAYAASKGGVAQLTKAMANDWARYNIRVNAIGPGYFITPNTEPLREDPQRYQEISQRIPLGRWGTPYDLMGVSVFLASDASAYITGQVIFVDGGWLSS